MQKTKKKNGRKLKKRNKVEINDEEVTYIQGSSKKIINVSVKSIRMNRIVLGLN